MSHPLFGPEVRQMLAEHDDDAMAAFCENLHPATVAEALSDEFDTEEVWAFLQHTGISNQAAIFVYFPPETQVLLIEGGGRAHMARLIEQMSHDDRADLLRRLPPLTVESILRLVDEADRKDIASLVKYPEDTAGGLMTTDYAWLPEQITVAEALDRLRLQAPDRETIYYVFIVDDARKLIGVASLRDLIMAPRQALMRDIMETAVITVSVTDDRQKVAHVMARYDLAAVPVIDPDGKLVGIVTHDDAIDVVVSEATEEVHRMGGMDPLEENYLEASFLLVWRKRAFWLSCLFFAELFTFTALSHFEDAIAEVVVLSLFVPLCISTGGNSGSQAATLITRSMALGQVGGSDWLRVFRHEVVMGIVLGLTLGCIGFVRAWLTPESVRSNSPPRRDAFEVRVPKSEPKLAPDERGVVRLPRDARQTIHADEGIEITLPEDERHLEPPTEDGDFRVYRFPAKCTIRQKTVGQWGLATVVALSVAGICLWGTLMGSMLPLVFRRLGVDPGIASSPFVATFVDVTGIIIYFSIARVVLSDILG
jgi:magnesium transporter